MAKIYISYQHNDKLFVGGLAKRLKIASHTVVYDGEILSPGASWRAALEQGLKSAEVFIVVISGTTTQSSHVLAEIGAARAYAAESNRMLLIPVVIDEGSLPPSLHDIMAIIQPDRSLEEICPRIEAAISAFIGRRAALDVEASKVAEKLNTNAADYIKVALDSLGGLEWRDRILGYIWYGLGFASLVLGVGVALFGLDSLNSGKSPSVELILVAALKTLLIVGLLGACAKYAFSLGKSYASEALKCSDRIHAIRFGEFYLRAFGERTQWTELKEVFQHWNIDRNSSFSSMDVSSFDPKLIESMIDLAKVMAPKASTK